MIRLHSVGNKVGEGTTHEFCRAGKNENLEGRHSIMGGSRSQMSVRNCVSEETRRRYSGEGRQGTYTGWVFRTEYQECVAGADSITPCAVLNSHNVARLEFNKTQIFMGSRQKRLLLIARGLFRPRFSLVCNALNIRKELLHFHTK